MNVHGMHLPPGELGYGHSPQWVLHTLRCLAREPHLYYFQRGSECMQAAPTGVRHRQQEHRYTALTTVFELC